jgi:hypothetical protein
MNFRRWTGGVVAGSLLLAGGIATGAIAQDTLLLQEAGVLEDGDNVLQSDGSLYDEYIFEGEEGQAVSISLTSEEFDTYLAIITPDGQVLGENDDVAPGSTDSALDVTLPLSGPYLVIANGFDSSSRGAYTLEVNLVTE